MAIDEDDGPQPGNLVDFRKPSGSQNRARAAASPLAAGNDDLDGFDADVLAALRDLGPPPRRNPPAMVLWQQDLSGIVAWAWGVGKIGPAQAARLKGMAEAIRTGGMVAVKATTAKLQKDVAERVGAVPETTDGLDDFPSETPHMGRTR